MASNNNSNSKCFSLSLYQPFPTAILFPSRAFICPPTSNHPPSSHYTPLFLNTNLVFYISPQDLGIHPLPLSWPGPWGYISLIFLISLTTLAYSLTHPLSPLFSFIHFRLLLPPFLDLYQKLLRFDLPDPGHCILY